MREAGVLCRELFFLWAYHRARSNESAIPFQLADEAPFAEVLPNLAEFGRYGSEDAFLVQEDMAAWVAERLAAISLGPGAGMCLEPGVD